MREERKNEIQAAMATMTTSQLGQALRDAKACRESRRTTRGCGCFCCDLYDHVESTGADLSVLSHMR